MFYEENSVVYYPLVAPIKFPYDSRVSRKRWLSSSMYELDKYV
jgi:hypothetical protein